ncbi:MAG: formyl transferase [Candidatus Omnitrophica bacterium CG1_02_49_16]|nr:MAG: formyl transferase [Candidatus Omnitrophica bacterium CG1_02_49_16]
MRIIFIGCVEFSFLALKKTLSLHEAEVVGVITRTRSSFHSDFHSLQPLAVSRGIPCFDAENYNNKQLVDRIKRLGADIIYCFGWSQLLSADVLHACPIGAIGFHPAELPKNRGRHPIIWALALGLPKTASTFFWMDAGADLGDILDQKPVRISNKDDAGSLYRKIALVALRQIEGLTPRLAHGTVKRVPQEGFRANSWRKRSKEDGCIDWRMSGRSVYNLVRALTRPYPGAYCIYKGREYPVWKSKAELFHEKNVEPGKVLESKRGKILVKCGEGAVRLLEHGFKISPKKGEYL